MSKGCDYRKAERRGGAAPMQKKPVTWTGLEKHHQGGDRWVAGHAPRPWCQGDNRIQRSTAVKTTESRCGGAVKNPHASPGISDD